MSQTNEKNKSERMIRQNPEALNYSYPDPVRLSTLKTFPQLAVRAGVLDVSEFATIKTIPSFNQTRAESLTARTLGDQKIKGLDIPNKELCSYYFMHHSRWDILSIAHFDPKSKIIESQSTMYND